MKNKSALLLLMIFTVMWSSIGGFLFGRYFFNNYDDNAPIEVTNECTPQTVAEITNCADIPDDLISSKFKGLYYERIIVNGTTDMGEPLNLILHLTRKELGPNRYLHSYLITYIAGDTSLSNSTSNEFDSPTPRPLGFVTQYENIEFSDVSTIENYTLQLNMDGRILNISIEGLEGDFIVKNKADYIRYVSTGVAEMSINDGTTFKVNAFVDQVISNDYSKSIYFSERSTLGRETHSIVMWDEASNFYLVDVSEVEPSDSPLQSHAWFLYKESETRLLQKGFTIEINNGGQVDKEMPNSFYIVTTDPEYTFELSTSHVNGQVGIVSGTVTHESQTLSVQGHFSYENYF